MSNERVINGNKLDTNELMSLVSAEQYDKLEEAWLGIVESNNKNLQSLFDVIDLLIKREERKRAHEFLMMLVPYYKQKGLYQEVLMVFKRVLECNP
jgi:tetrahydrodipicolinate N-succinyltransferase